MSLIAHPLRRIGMASLLAIASHGSAAAQVDGFWPIDEATISTGVTGEASKPLPVEQAPSAQEEMPAALAQATPDQQPGPAAEAEVDESALRFFARQGDTRRLEIEISRLRALYPDWTPPEDPLAIPDQIDERLEVVWDLYSQNRLAEARQAIAQRQTEEPGWQPPDDLLDRLALSESRERIVNASEISQFDTVIRIATDNPELLTCAEVDVLWRVAEAFARTDRQPRARDAYRYILDNCDNPQERLATVQNAGQLLDPEFLDPLLELERVNEEGVGEFEPVRDGLTRQIVAESGEDATLQVPAEQLSRLERLAEEESQAADALLLGWHYLVREAHAEAERWFRLAREEQDSADASEGLALALIARGQHAEAEDVIYPWRTETDDTRSVHLAAAANLLGDEPRPVLSSEILARIVDAAVDASDAATARQLGWYARGWEQHETAALWFSTALRWDEADEPAAYGLALTYQELGNVDELAEIKRLWSDRSERIGQIGLATDGPAPVPAPQQSPAPAQRSQAPAAAQPRAAAPTASPPAAPQRAAVGQSASASGGSCRVHLDPRSLSSEAALTRAWCLMDADRPAEAVAAFGAALESGVERIRRDAAWGQSLAYLRLEQVDRAAVAAVAAPQDPQRANELQTAILAQRAVGAFEHGRFVEALLALDQYALIAPERIDLMVLRGYAYLNLNRMADARRVFQAVAGTGNRDGLRGLAEIERSLRPTD